MNIENTSIYGEKHWRHDVTMSSEKLARVSVNTLWVLQLIANALANQIMCNKHSALELKFKRVCYTYPRLRPPGGGPIPHIWTSSHQGSPADSLFQFQISVLYHLYHKYKKRPMCE